MIKSKKWKIENKAFFNTKDIFTVVFSFFYEKLLVIYLSTYLYISIYQPIYLFIYQSIYISIYIYISFYLSIYLSIYEFDYDVILSDRFCKSHIFETLPFLSGEIVKHYQDELISQADT